MVSVCVLFGNQFLNQARAGSRCVPGFLKSFSCGMCVCTPSRPQIISGMILTLNDSLNNYSCFSIQLYGYCHRCCQ